MNLRIIGINSADSRTIKAKFTSKLNKDINALNVTVEGVNQSTPDALVRSVAVAGDVLIITTLPLTPYTKYRVTFSSILGTPFSSEDSRYFLPQDGVANVVEILGAENPNDIIRDNMVQELSGQPYVPERGTLLRDVQNQMSSEIWKAIQDVRQTKNENYLSFVVKDERKQRSYGAFDRLNEEGAYKILRVGLTPDNQTLSGQMNYTSFPFDIISLQSMSVTDESLDVGNGIGTFNQFVLSTRKYPVTKVNSIRFIYQNGDTYNYDINQYGYQLKEPKYDTTYASAYLLLEDNQIQYNTAVLEDPLFKVPGGGDTVLISYEFKSLGRIIKDDSVEVSQTVDVIRAPVPALTNAFALAHSPVVNSSNSIPNLGGISFLDPYSETPFQTVHPAFTREIIFNTESMPKAPGEYSVDYSTGRVFVYGAVTNDGTGAFPPAATYKYRNIFRRDLDYTYRAETSELVASPIRDLEGQIARISYLYEQVLVPDVDYKEGVHQEVINERIENRLISSNTLLVKNAPITNVFRIFNETTGEIYRINRFLNDKVVFSASAPPSIINQVFERAAFETITNEQLISSYEFINTLGTRVFSINLLNSNIISSTEDVIGSSYNSSISFSRSDIFASELFFDGQILSAEQNTDKLTVGAYQVDYRAGMIYVGVSVSQDYSLGTVNYKAPRIIPQHPHLMAVDKVYHSISQVFGDNKQVIYQSFGDGFITPATFDVSDERFLNYDTSLPYLVTNGTIAVSDDIKTVRHIFDNEDLITNINPIDFGPSASYDANVITLDPEGVEIRGQYTLDGSLQITIDTVPGISLVSIESAIRSDNQQLIDGYQTIVGNTVTFSIASSAAPSDVVDVIVKVTMNSSSTPIVDYDRGEYYVDYTYLNDEILISYEHGDNSIDFRESTALDYGREYFVTYMVGALRDSLLENFGSMISIEELNSFDINLDRERYRDALAGALQSFLRGPTVPSMKDLVAKVTKIQPELLEAIFQYWALGISPLYKGAFKLNPKDTDRVIVPAVFDSGFLPTKSGDFITFPVSSNLRLNEGTMEMDIIPHWDGLDNDANVTFAELKLDGYSISDSDIYIGSSSFNPTSVDGEFSVSKFDDVVGLPSAIHTNTGLFIFYDDQAKRWNVLAKTDPNDGYQITGKISSSGEVYDVKKIPGVSDYDDIIRSTQDTIKFEFNINAVDLASPDGYSESDGYISGYSFDGLTFMADSLHYIFDFAETNTTNRFSLYKDGRGYLNFCVWDSGGGHIDSTRKNRYIVSADIQNWENGERHNVAISWKLNTRNRMDEMHLFVDGFEVPNIIRYGGIPSASSVDRFRTVQPEVVAGTVPNNCVTGVCATTQGSNTIVAVGVDFGFAGINPGDVLEIYESGFSYYTILTVNGPTLTLSATMPATLSNAKFSANPYSVVVSSEIDIYKNIAVSSLLGGTEEELAGLRANIPGYSISKNSLNQNVLTILGDVQAGSQILIRTLGLNHRRCREKVYLWSDQAVLKTQLPPPINLDEVQIRSVILPYVVLGPSNSTIIGPTFNASFIPTGISNTTEGRQLEIRISAGNTTFSSPTQVTINGTSNAGATEVLNFTAAGKQITTKKWMTITSIDVVTTAVSTSIPGAGIEVKEAYSVTVSNGNNIYPVIRYGYQTQSGLTLEGDGSDIVYDANGFFPVSDVNNMIVIESPLAVAGTYQIVEKIDNNTIRLDSATGTPFTGGTYKTYNITIGRSGFQNGFFFLEQAGTVNVPYELPPGYYEFDYSTYLEVPFKPVEGMIAYLGSDYHGINQANAVIDEFRILSRMLTDTRVGETVGDNDYSITTDSVKISPFRKNKQTLVLLHLDSFPIVNDAEYYTFADRYYLQSSTSVNDNFGQSICFDERGITYESKNRLTTDKEGTIEFWVSPMFDTYNDPVPRVYFDAASSVMEEVVSISKGTVKVSGRIGEVLSVRLATDLTQTGTNYYVGGSIASDFQTINLGSGLPYQQVPVIVTYIPSGVVGDRITILKDSAGFISFNVIANGELFQVRQPVFWARDTWHRVKCTFIFNSKNNLDQIRLFADGEERSSIKFGEGILFGEGVVFGATTSGVTDQILVANMDFRDIINNFHIGQDFTGAFPAKARMDNFRLSNKALNALTIAGQPMDVNYSGNLNNVFPVIENAYTTMLLNFDTIIQNIDDFAELRDSFFGIFNFTLNIIDSFEIVEDSAQVKAILEAMIYALKPANAKVDINYIR